MIKKIMLIFVSLVMCLLVMTNDVDASSASGKCGDNVYWSYDDGVLTISGEGDMYDYNSDSPWNSYNANIKTVVIEDGVTSIGNSAFESCSILTNVRIPNTITSIGTASFFWCKNLETIKIPDNVQKIETAAFMSCYSLKNIIIPNGVTEIGDGTFSGCFDLKSISIPNTVTRIGDSAFSNCQSLVNITLPDGITSIEDNLFSSCTSLKNIIIPDTVTSIGKTAFNRCVNLTNIEIPENVEFIGDSAFYMCETFTNIKIPDKVKKIGECTFRYCESLENIEIPDSVTIIGNTAFEYCKSLKSIKISENVISVGDYAFGSLDGASIYFKGHAPEFADNAFVYSDVKAYYPKDNETWTKDKLKDYEASNIQWIAYDPEFPLIDVSDKQWYHPYIKEAYDLGLMTGATETLFKPNANMNRGMVAIVFHRMEGSEKVEYTPVFKDVPNNQYYTTSVLWMKSKGIINGYNDGTFKPLRNVSREEMATMIYNFAKYKGLDVKSEHNIKYFNDYNKITQYAKAPLQWAVENSLMSGKDNGTRLDPLGTATRAECAKMLVQAYKVIYNK